ncbi:MAG TPA: hypothetical protein VHX61_06430 [Rhizomicrobium sp.]|nr:hypothetical protein [Rhizomicrobium sp.]
MVEQQPVLILDLHNTLYDEVMEYGGAMDAAIGHFLEAAKDQGVAIDEGLVCRQLSEAHARSGSDWDDDVWSGIAELQKLSRLGDVIDQAVALRRKVSERLTRERAYKSTIEALITLKESGAAVYVATEATENAAGDGIVWLGLDGVLDGIYAWPFHNGHGKAGRTPIHRFPPDPERPGFSVQKPHPLILGSIILDVAKAEGRVPQNVMLEDVFDLTCDEDLRVLARAMGGNAPSDGQRAQVREVLRAVQTKLAARKGPYGAALDGIRRRCLYVGDSYFKDGLLAANADIPFVFAGYGTAISDADTEVYDKCMKRLFSVTGWDGSLIRLKHEAGNVPEIKDRINPYFVCQESLQELVEFMGRHSS